MAYMHKETFDVIQNLYSGVVPKNPEHYFEIDELIALPVQALNRKGYITKFCCAGHRFEWFENNMRRIQTNETHIMFKEGISLPSLPSGWIIDKSSFALKNFPDNLKIAREFGIMSGTFKFLRVVLESMEQLYEWALNLPDFNK